MPAGTDSSAGSKSPASPEAADPEHRYQARRQRHDRMGLGWSGVAAEQSGHPGYVRNSAAQWGRAQRALARMERSLRNVGKQPLDPFQWRALQRQLDDAEREFRRAEIAERRQFDRSRWSRQQVSQPESPSARWRREAAARDERRDSVRRQQAARDVTRTFRTLRRSLDDLARSSRKSSRWGR